MSVYIRKLLIYNKSTTRKVLSSFINKRNISADVTSPYSAIDVPNIPLEEHIFSKFDNFANKIALVSTVYKMLQCIILFTILYTYAKYINYSFHKQM